jgi:hypothetical protein
MVFMLPQRLIVPLFQRPYVWNQESQWEPLWNDLIRVTERFLADAQEGGRPHFLGAVVLQQLPNQTGLMQERTIIDGQQRLTTLQLLLDALHAELISVKATAPAMRIEPLVANAEPFCVRHEDRFKVWPTNRDRPAFNAVMAAPPPVDHDRLDHRGERMVEAHRYFSEQAREWLSLNGSEDIPARAAAIETVARDLLQMVVIDLAAEENAQEIFETLNARGAQLTAADLIKNFIFQRLIESGADVEDTYERHWKEFESGFWEKEVTVGRVRYPRSSIFLNHWLVARTGEEVVAREVFTRFKTYADHDTDVPMATLVEQVDRAGSVYRSFVDGATTPGPIARLGLFGYRTGVMESEVIKPLVLYLLDPEASAVPPDQIAKALDSVESWMVRRMLVRATTKSYTQVVAELITQLRKGDRDHVGDAVQEFLVGQTSGSRYWPDDDEVRAEVRTLLAYRRLGRGRLRMVLEAIEDFLRGWTNESSTMDVERVTRGKLAIEHVMPRKWAANWPLDSRTTEAERDRLIHTFGNLTLLTGKLNTRVSNGPWSGPTGKRSAFNAHDVLFLNRQLATEAEWSDSAVRARTDALAQLIVTIWPAPPGHRSGFIHDKPPQRHRVDLADLLNAGSLEPGMTLFPRRAKFADRVATLLPDGRLDIDGRAFSSPSEAAVSITGKPTNGWWWFLVDQASRRSLRDVRRDYIEALAIDADDDDSDDEDDDEP